MRRKISVFARPFLHTGDRGGATGSSGRVRAVHSTSVWHCSDFLFRNRARARTHTHEHTHEHQPATRKDTSVLCVCVCVRARVCVCSARSLRAATTPPPQPGTDRRTPERRPPPPPSSSVVSDTAAASRRVRARRSVVPRSLARSLRSDTPTLPPRRPDTRAAEGPRRVVAPRAFRTFERIVVAARRVGFL